MNRETMEVRPTAELTEEEKASGKWISIAEMAKGMNRHERRRLGAVLRKQAKRKQGK